MSRHKVWGGETGVVNSLQFKHKAFPFLLPYRRLVLKPRSTWKGGDFLFLSLNQRVITTTKENAWWMDKSIPWSAVWSHLKRSSNCWMSKGSDVYPTNGVTTNITVISLSNQATSRRPNKAIPYGMAKGNRTQWIHFQMKKGKGYSAHMRAQDTHINTHTHTPWHVN